MGIPRDARSLRQVRGTGRAHQLSVNVKSGRMVSLVAQNVDGITGCTATLKTALFAAGKQHVQRG